jgi:EAL domain-containing protein (putative c-di-GMP-specific phosphodiesterase class I)
MNAFCSTPPHTRANGLPDRATVRPRRESQRLRPFFQRLAPLGQEDGRAGNGPRIEVLARLWDPLAQAYRSPGPFIAEAERHDRIGALDRHMVGQVLALLGACPVLQAALGQVMINLSAITLGQADLGDDILALLDRHRVRADLLCFEITETAAIGPLAQARRTMRALQQRGCRFALDDFGSGHASFALLRDLPFESIKLDGSFMRNLDHDPVRQALVCCMSDMAHRLGLPVVAEGIENAATARRLGELGVPWGQGFHFHRPEPMTAAALQATTPEQAPPVPVSAAPAAAPGSSTSRSWCASRTAAR